MLIDISSEKYNEIFRKDPNPFISESFMNITKQKVDKIVRLVKSNDEGHIGLIAGIKNKTLLAPFSAPFGGFHYKDNAVIYKQIYSFLFKLKQYISDQKLDGLHITLPPNVYNENLNAKFANAFIRLGYTMQTPDIVSYVDLRHFTGKFTKSGVRHNCSKAVRNGLSFSHVTDAKSIKEVYNIVSANRKDQDRDIYMTLHDILDVDKIIPVDFFLARNIKGEGVGASVIYRGHDKIAQGIFMGDLISARKLYPTDFLYLNIFNYYKELGYDFIDLGKSSSDGEPNVGLVHFKETHNCISTLGYTFSLQS